MNEFLKMDVFFVVTTIAVAVLGVMLGVICFYVIRILRDVEHVSERVAEESDQLSKDIADLRTNVRSEGMKFKHVAEFFGTIGKRHTRSRATRKSDSDN